MTERHARAILEWHYDPPYDIYDVGAGDREETVQVLLDPQYAYHAILTAEAIRSQGARLAGWVANSVDPGMRNRDENIRTLEEMIDAPNLGIVPWQTGAQTDVIAGWLDVGPLLPED
jgi:hypothetical protein